MNRDQIERALRDPGPREAGYVERPLHIGADGRRDARLLTLLRFASLGAAVVAGVAVAVVLTRGSLFSLAPGAGATASPTPLPTPASAARACTSGDLAWTTDPWGGGAGARGTTVTIRGVSSLNGCRIQGAAKLILRDANGAVVAQGNSAVSAVQVRANGLFQMGIHWSNWCSNPPAAPLSLTLTLPHDTSAAPLEAPGGVLVPPCNGAGAPTDLGATSFQPSSGPAPQG